MIRVCDRVTLTGSEADWTVDMSECEGRDAVHGYDEVTGELIIAGAKESDFTIGCIVKV